MTGRHIILSALGVAFVAGALKVAWAYDTADADTPRTSPEDYYTHDLTPSRRAVGALLRVQEAAVEMLQPDRAYVWGRQGRLTPRDLTNAFYSVMDDGAIAGFNVLDAEGFSDRYKCNLFVFELAFRAGLRIPLIPRQRGYGYAGPDEVLRQLQRGRFDQGWAALANHLDYDGFQQATDQGVPFIVVGEGAEGRAGHMGFVDVVHHIDTDDMGRVLSFEYTGWEANGDGAHYRRRTWNVARFTSINILELSDLEPQQSQCFAVAPAAAPSDLDAPRYARRRGGSTPPGVAASP